MNNVLVPVDAEALVVAYLSEKMPTYDVSTRLRDRSGAITIEQTGGSRTSIIHDSPVIAVQTWHADDITAGDMCREAFGWLMAIHDDPVYGYRVREAASVGGPVNFPDPTARTPRWQCSVELNISPVALGS